jgi:anaerobic ribonucleoside-triphosphate reductase activating protein
VNYQAYYSVDVVNGPGTRSTLFVSGCIHKCRGCHNAATWNPESGPRFTLECEDQILADLACPIIPKQGLSLSGGDPLLPENLADIGRLVQRVKRELPNKDIWCWTGYERSQLTREQLGVVRFIDVLIDGKFEHEQASASLVWRGSTNQRIVPVTAWLDCAAESCQ